MSECVATRSLANRASVRLSSLITQTQAAAAVTWTGDKVGGLVGAWDGGRGLDLDQDTSVFNDTTAHRLALQMRLAR